MNAEPFYNKSQPLSFRGVSDDLAEQHVEGSECCLIHTDNYLSATKGVWMHPGIRVGYSLVAYEAVHPNGNLQWLSAITVAQGLWENRLRRWFTTPILKEWIVRRRVTSWEGSGAGLKETGLQCLINEMQVLVSNGWAHV